MGRHRRDHSSPSAAPSFAVSGSDGCAFACALVLALASFGAGFRTGREWERQEPPPTRRASASAPLPSVGPVPPPPPTASPAPPRVEAPAPALEALGLPPLLPARRNLPPPAMDERVVRLQPLFHATDVGALVRDGAGRIWAGTTDCLATVDGGPPLVVTRASLSWYVPHFRSLAVDPTGAVCFVGGLEGEFLIRRCLDGTLDAVPMTDPSGASHTSILAGVPDGVVAVDPRLHNGVVWVPYLDGQWRAPRSLSRGRPYDSVCSIVPDGRGVLIKTQTSIFRVEGETAHPFVSLEADAASTPTAAQALLQTLSGHRATVDMSPEASRTGGWTGLDMEGLSRRRYTPYHLVVRPGAPPLPIWGESGAVNVGARRFELPQAAWDGTYVKVDAALADGADRVWVGTDRGLAVVEGGELRFVGAVASTLPRPVLAAAAYSNGSGVAAGRDGTVVVCWGSGAGRLTTQAVVPLDLGPGLSATIWPDSASADLLVGTAAGLVAVGLDAGGATRLETLGTWAELGAGVGLASAGPLERAVTDLGGNLWAQTNEGLWRAPPGRPLAPLPPPLAGKPPFPGLLALSSDGRVWTRLDGGRIAGLVAEGPGVRVATLLDVGLSAFAGSDAGGRVLLAGSTESWWVTPDEARATGLGGMRFLVSASSGVIWGLQQGVTDEGTSRLLRIDGEHVSRLVVESPRLGWGRFSMAPAPDGGLYLMDTGLWHLAAADLE